MTDILCMGQLVLDCLVRNIHEKSPSQRSAVAEEIGLHVGGDALNEAVISSRLGHSVAVAGFVGDDPAGKIIRSALAKQGCDISRIVSRDGVRTPIANIMIGSDGSRTSVNSMAVRLNGNHIDPEMVDRFRAVTFASCFRAPLDDAENNYQLAKAARRKGALVIADCKVPLYEIEPIAAFGRFFSCVDYFFPNETEAGYYSGVSLTSQSPQQDFRKAAEFFLDLGAKNVIIKAGSRGCYFLNRTEEYLLDALPAEVIDTTGAGDSFVAGFLNALLEGKNNRDCCLYGLACASLAVQSQGASSGVRSREELEEVFRKYCR
ncbi:MAG: sugar kinase [Erysipelotrichaceae bacterium]|nr:sugar kinase [Erysipelotrichaceae bacterium]